MNAVLYILAGIGALFLVCAALLAIGLVNAPAGYEDETGFHVEKGN